MDDDKRKRNRTEEEPELAVFRPDREGLEQALGTLEAQVMEAVWDHDGPAAVDDVRSALEVGGKESAYTTIMTTMSRLFDKGLLERELEGRAYHYTAALTRSELGSSVSRRVVDALMGSFAEPAMAVAAYSLACPTRPRLSISGRKAGVL